MFRDYGERITALILAENKRQARKILSEKWDLTMPEEWDDIECEGSVPLKPGIVTQF